MIWGWIAPRPSENTKDALFLITSLSEALIESTALSGLEISVASRLWSICLIEEGVLHKKNLLSEQTSIVIIVVSFHIVVHVLELYYAYVSYPLIAVLRAPVSVRREVEIHTGGMKCNVILEIVEADANYIRKWSGTDAKLKKC